MKHLIFILLAGIFFTSCTKERLTGNNNTITETRDISDFTGISGSGSNRIYVNYGTAFKVEIKGSSNLIPVYESKVRNNMLHLGYENGVNVHDDDIEVYVTLPLLTEVALSGSGNISIAGNFTQTPSFRLLISGSGSADVQDAFECNSLTATVSGSGDADLLKITSEQADVSISGSGNVKVTATENLKAKISGSGNVYYAGDPVVSANISGSGKVQKLQ